MGEYLHRGADGERVKIGTCEDLYCLRYDQLGEVYARSGDDSHPREHLDAYRFRFPFPDEDGVAPGDFADPFRGLMVHGIAVPADVGHGLVQLTGHGYVCSIPCPESYGAPGMDAVAATWSVEGHDPRAVRVGRNGFPGSVKIAQQAVRGGLLVTIGQCGGCSVAYRYPDIESVVPVVDAIEAEAEREQAVAERNNTPGNAAIALRLVTIARRIVAGYAVEVPA